MPTKRAVYEIANFKASTDTPGEFTADVSVFGNVDVQGDRVMPDAFTKSLKEWKQSGNPIPVIWNHDWDDPFAHIGYVTNAVVTPKALRITGKNDVEKPFAGQVQDLLVSRRVTGMSFSYEVEAERPGKDGANELTQLRLIEVGPTLQGANPSAQLVQAKSLLEAAATKEAGEAVSFDDIGEKAGRRLSQATQSEVEAIENEAAALRDSAHALATRARALLGSAEDEPKNVEKSASDTSSETEGAQVGDADLDESEEQVEPSTTEGQTAKSPDESILAIRSRIEAMRATTGVTE